MSQSPAVLLLILSIAAQIALTFYVLIRLGRTRVAHVRARRVRIADIALGQNAWPEDATKLSNNYNSQFQVPVLFFLAALTTLSLNAADLVLAMLGVAFVVSRVMHTVIHIGSNVVIKRFNAFVTGVALVIAMWVWLIAKILIGL